jgi:hypothetical protein
MVTSMTRRGFVSLAGATTASGALAVQVVAASAVSSKHVGELIPWTSQQPC